MQPISFPEQTTILAKDQPQYLPLPCCITPTEIEGISQYTCKYELTDLDIEQILKTRSIYFSQFGNCFHPIKPQISHPFKACQVEYKYDQDGFYSFYIPMVNGYTVTLEYIRFETAIDKILEVTNLTAEQICFIEKQSE